MKECYWLLNLFADFFNDSLVKSGEVFEGRDCLVGGALLRIVFVVLGFATTDAIEKIKVCALSKLKQRRKGYIHKRTHQRHCITHTHTRVRAFQNTCKLHQSTPYDPRPAHREEVLASCTLTLVASTQLMASTAASRTFLLAEPIWLTAEAMQLPSIACGAIDISAVVAFCNHIQTILPMRRITSKNIPYPRTQTDTQLPQPPQPSSLPGGD